MYLGSVEHLAVIDEDFNLIGIISIRDVARRIHEFFETTSVIEFSSFKSLLNEPVENIASKPFIRISKGSENLFEALKIMLENNIGFIPIVRDGKLVTAYTELHACLVLINDTRPAIAYATRDIVWGEAEQPIIEALGYMLERGFRRLPLQLDKDKLYIITMGKILYSISSAATEDSLLKNIATLASPATVLRDAEIGTVAELIFSLPERAVLLYSSQDDSYYIITERDLVKAALDKAI